MHSSSHISTAHLHEDLEISPTCETSDQHLECSNDSNSKTDKATKLHVESKYCQVNMRGDELMRRTIGTQTGVAFTECGTQTEETCLNITEPDEVHDSDDDDDDIDLNSSQETSYPTDSTQFLSPQKKRLKSLLSECSDTETEGHTGSNSEVETDLPSTIKSPQDDLVFLVFEQQLFELFKKCPECGAPVVHKDKSTQGTLLCVHLKCLNGHKFSWNSQPMLGRMAAGNLLLTSSIVLSGATYTKTACMAEVLKLQFLSEKTFCNIQDEYVFPVVNEAWMKEQNSVASALDNRDVWLSGDGRCDSPGFNAKYGTYTMFDQDTDKIIDFNVIQVSEVGSSNAMEREGFKRCMNRLMEMGANVKVVATDGHIGIACDMKKDHPDKDHQQDVWHISKRITTKLTEKAKKKDCGELFPWIKAVSNHLWWCAETCEGSKDLIREKWISLIYHTTNIHEWDTSDVYHKCSHPPIPREEARKKQWLKRGTTAHDALKAVVLDKNILKAIQQLNLCCHTGSLEVYHSVLTSYVPKRQHFSFKGMVARSQLAALHHNANTEREQAIASKGENEGELRYKIVFPKRTKDWVAKPIKCKPTKDHLLPILDAIVARKNQAYDDRSEGVDTSHVAQNIASLLRPPKEEVIAKHTTRFSRN